ncbi:MAG: hypothetical protein ABFE13_27465 [Phycisphaerales bacterium]
MERAKFVSLLPITGVFCIVGLTLAVPVAWGTFKSRATGTSTATASERWEYRIIEFGDVIIDVRLSDQEIREAEKLGVQKARSLEDRFNQLGQDGWELVTFGPSAAAFKRPMR